MRQVVRLRGEHFQEGLRLRLGEGQAGRIGYPGQKRLDAAQDVRRRGACVLRSHLEAGVLGRVVAGGNNQPSSSAASEDCVSDNGRGCRAVAQEDGQVVGGQHLGDGGGERLRGEAGVVSDDDAAATESGLLGGKGGGLGAAAGGG